MRDNNHPLSDNIINTGKLNGIFRGVVEDNKDPWKAGRCRVRIFGIHSDSKIQEGGHGIPTNHLPWAEPAGPIFGGLSGIGSSGVPVQGSQVFLFFESGDIMQPRYFATAIGISFGGQTPNTQVGFSDPDGVYPLAKKAFNSDHDTGEGPSDYTKTYVLSGHCGHKVILDSTPQNENITIKHGTTGAYIKLDVDGNIQISSAPSATSYDSTGDRFVITTGHHTMSVSKDLLISSKSSKEMVGGNKSSEITGALSETVLENWDIKAKGIEINSNGDILEAASGEASFVAGEDCLIKSSDQKVLINSLKSNVELNALIGKLQGRALTVDIKGTISAEFAGLMTTIGGTTSMITTVSGQIVMIG